ncbi:MAG: METTL5 family protein [Thermoplasmata archaeon]
MRRSELLRALERVPSFVRPDASLEQVITPSEAAATLLAAADRLDGLEGRSVLDLGCGTGRLSIGAALLGARPVRAVDVDPGAIELAQTAARKARVDVTFEAGDVAATSGPAELVVMNPPFGAQTRHADRPFWDVAFALAQRSVYAFSLADSRTFIAQRAVERGAQVLEVGSVPWALPRTFAHHVRRRVPLDVDLWAIRTEPNG